MRKLVLLGALLMGAPLVAGALTVVNETGKDVEVQLVTNYNPDAETPRSPRGPRVNIAPGHSKTIPAVKPVQFVMWHEYDYQSFDGKRYTEQQVKKMDKANLSRSMRRSFKLDLPISRLETKKLYINLGGEYGFAKKGSRWKIPSS